MQNKRHVRHKFPHGLLHPCSFLRGPRLLGVDLELLDRVDLLSRVQTLWAGVSAVLDGVAAVELELVIDGIQALLGELVTAVLYPPGETVHVYSAEQSGYTNTSQFQSSNWTKRTRNKTSPLQMQYIT